MAIEIWQPVNFAMAHAGTVTLLFTDLVNSTELLKRMGDEEAQRIFRAHHKLLSDAVVAHGGHEVKWLGDGLMVAFPSAADAVRCAIAIQQSARRHAAGVRLGIRAGLHVGEALREEADYFGTAVVVARRLCETASAVKSSRAVWSPASSPVARASPSATTARSSSTAWDPSPPPK